MSAAIFIGHLEFLHVALQIVFPGETDILIFFAVSALGFGLAYQFHDARIHHDQQSEQQTSDEPDIGVLSNGTECRESW